MYDITVYDEAIGQFVPVRDKNTGKVLTFSTWIDAQDMAYGTLVKEDYRQYKVEYRTVRRKKARR